MADLSGITVPLPESVMESFRWLDGLLQSQPATEKEFQPAWEAYKYMLRGKLYAYIGMNDKNGRPIITMKLDPAYSDLLRGEYPDIVPGYYMNKVHWSTAYLDGDVPREILADMARAAYGAVLATLSKKARLEIQG